MPIEPIEPGQIYRDSRFYCNPAGEFKSKYVLILAISPGDNLIFSLLTSQQHGRPTDPRCYHGNPYSGFYLGTLGNPLSRDSWLDLRRLHEAECDAFLRNMADQIIEPIAALETAALLESLDCAAAAEDTTRHQERTILDTRARLAANL